MALGLVGRFFSRSAMMRDNEPQGGHRNYLYWIWSTFVVWHEYIQFNCTVPKLVACAIRLGGNSSNSPQNGMKKKSGQKKATGFLVIFSLQSKSARRLWLFFREINLCARWDHTEILTSHLAQQPYNEASYRVRSGQFSVSAYKSNLNSL